LTSVICTLRISPNNCRYGPPNTKHNRNPLTTSEDKHAHRRYVFVVCTSYKQHRNTGKQEP